MRYCELILNGEYRGLYLMVETITNGNDCRLDLSDQVYGTSVTGYLLRGDRTVEEDLDGIRDVYTYLERELNTRNDFSIRYPKRAVLAEDLREQIELDFAALKRPSIPTTTIQTTMDIGTGWTRTALWTITLSTSSL